MITDSGVRKEFESGAVRDIKEGKGRCDLLPLSVIERLLGWNYSSSSILQDLEKFQKTADTNFLYNVACKFIDERYGDRTKAVLELSVHYEEGANKYTPWNWTKGIPLTSFIDSAVRHYLKWLAGMQDESHDRAFLWNIVGAIWTTNNRLDLVQVLNYSEGYQYIEEIE